MLRSQRLYFHHVDRAARTSRELHRKRAESGTVRGTRLPRALLTFGSSIRASWLPLCRGSVRILSAWRITTAIATQLFNYRLVLDTKPKKTQGLRLTVLPGVRTHCILMRILCGCRQAWRDWDADWQAGSGPHRRSRCDGSGPPCPGFELSLEVCAGDGGHGPPPGAASVDGPGPD